MEVIIHRGAKQIGGSCVEIRTDRTRLIIDVGEELPDIAEPNKASSRLHVDDLFNDSKTTERPIDAVFISHNHGDHIGLYQNLKENIPIYIGKTAAEIQNTICDFTVGNKKISIDHLLEDRAPIFINELTITPFAVDHSAFDAYAFLIDGEGKKILYTGDFRQHGMNQDETKILMSLPEVRNPNLLLMEGTNIRSPHIHAIEEEEIGERAQKFMEKTKGNVFVLMSSANIDRIHQVYRAAQQTKRLFIYDIFTAHILSKLPGEPFNPRIHKDIQVLYPIWLTQAMFKIKGKEYLMYKYRWQRIKKDHLKTRKDLCIMVRENMLDDITIRMNMEEAGLIYSKWEGYKKSPKTKRFMDFIKTKGLADESIHTSGHADVSALQEFVGKIQPKKIVPIHTETPKKYRELFGEIVEVVGDGEVIGV